MTQSCHWKSLFAMVRSMAITVQKEMNLQQEPAPINSCTDELLTPCQPLKIPSMKELPVYTITTQLLNKYDANSSRDSAMESSVESIHPLVLTSLYFTISFLILFFYLFVLGGVPFYRALYVNTLLMRMDRIARVGMSPLGRFYHFRPIYRRDNNQADTVARFQSEYISSTCIIVSKRLYAHSKTLASNE